MTKLDFSLDMDRVQSSVQAAIRPAVETALASVDLKKKITEALLKPIPARELSPYDVFGAVYLSTRRSKESPDAPTLLDQMVHEGISNIAKEYVQRNLLEMQPEIERGFQKMMANSASKLSKSFAAAVADAFKDDWGFALDVKVSHTVPEAPDRGYDE